MTIITRDQIEALIAGYTPHPTDWSPEDHQLMVAAPDLRETCLALMDERDRLRETIPAVSAELLDQRQAMRETITILLAKLAEAKAAQGALKDAAASLASHACKCLSCGLVFDSEKIPHCDDDCPEIHADWEAPDSDEIAAAIRTLSPDATAALEAYVKPLRDRIAELEDEQDMLLKLSSNK